jgi:hypothetical protein
VGEKVCSIKKGVLNTLNILGNLLLGLKQIRDPVLGPMGTSLNCLSNNGSEKVCGYLIFLANSYLQILLL